MASQVPREFLIGNFKPAQRVKLREKRQKSGKKRAARPGNSELHLKAIRMCPCVVSLLMPAGDPHHIQSETGERGMQQRSTDKWALPMRRQFHDALHAVGSKNELRQLREWGIEDPHGLAAALWAARPEVDKPIAVRDAVAAMTRIIFAHVRGPDKGQKP